MRWGVDLACEINSGDVGHDARREIGVAGNDHLGRVLLPVLDALVVRMLQLAAVAITDAAVDRSRVFDNLIEPGVQIVANAMVIHGIFDAAVTGNPKFREIAEAFESFAGRQLPIGPSYDDVVLEKCRRFPNAAPVYKRSGCGIERSSAVLHRSCGLLWFCQARMLAWQVTRGGAAR